MSNFKTESRREGRYPVCEKIMYTISESPDETFAGFLTNISKSGLGLHLYKTHDKGSCITLKGDTNNHCMKATLKWISEMDTGLYMAGFNCY